MIPDSYDVAEKENGAHKKTALKSREDVRNRVLVGKSLEIQV